MKKGKGKGMTRREFMKGVGVGTAALGISSLAPRLVKPARAAKRDHILIGRVQPLTGASAAFGEVTPWVDNRALDEINAAGGIYIKELGKQVPVKIKIADAESDATKAAEVSARLILNNKVDMIYVSSSPYTVSPTAANCERYSVPCISTMMPAEMFLGGGPFQWSFMASISLMDFGAAFMEMWNQVETNRRVGLLAQNDTDGVHWAQGANAYLPPAGFTVVDLGRFPVGSPDYTIFINGWKREKVEILYGVLTPPDFHTAWRQCHREGFIPKVATIGKALLFVSALEATGEIGYGLSTEGVWHPTYPFKSSLKGYSARDLAEAWEAGTGKQWTQPLGGNYSGYEIIADVYKRARTLDKETVRNAMAETNIETIQGHVKFNEKKVAITPTGGLQWLKGTKWPYTSKIVAKGNYKMLPTSGKFLTLQEAQGLTT